MWHPLLVTQPTITYRPRMSICPPLLNRLLGTIVSILGTDWLPLPPPEAAFRTRAFSERDMTLQLK